MSKKFKTLVFLCTLFVSMFGMSITTFAVDTGGATITLIEGSMWSPGLPSNSYTSNIVNSETTASWSTYDSARYAGRKTEIGSVFNVSTSNNYGTLKFVASHYGPSGILDDVNNVIKDVSTGETICRGQTVGDYVYFTYTGRIPSKIKVLFYYNMPSDTSQALGGMYLNWSFEPISEIEQEETKAQVQADKTISDATNAIEDKSQGFIDALSGLVSSMSYSGIQCAWTFPALYLPEIPGVMSRIQLTSEKQIDIAYWVNQIPSDVLLLVQSVLTIALIVYCFKEFYGVIEYVLTMRGGGNSE